MDEYKAAHDLFTHDFIKILERKWYNVQEEVATHICLSYTLKGEVPEFKDYTRGIE